MQNSVFNRLLVASDHAGVELKSRVVSYLEANRDFFSLDSIIDYGAFNPVVRVDYPSYAQMVAKSVKDPRTAGILVCARGIGMSIAANRFKHIRAALCYDIRAAFFGRSHSDANVLVLSSEAENSKQTSDAILKTFLVTEFQGGRYQSRLDACNNLEIFDEF